MWEIRDARALEPLLAAALEDEHPRVRLEAWSALDVLVDGIGDVRDPQPLIKALRDENSEVQKIAADMLLRIRDVRAVQPLVVVLNDDNTDVARAAAHALGSIGDAAAVQPLVVAFIKDKRSDIWKEAEKALDSIDPNWQKSEAAKQAV
ncbi:HEAT repeat domain-containing protein [bacterium]|nr:MAG: HEAT repeat domain-containing protein [bacterium]